MLNGGIYVCLCNVDFVCCGDFFLLVLKNVGLELMFIDLMLVLVLVDIEGLFEDVKVLLLMLWKGICEMIFKLIFYF